MARYFRRRKFCRFTAENVTEIDYKDIVTLKTTSLNLARSYRAVSPVPAPNISVSWHAPSSVLVTWLCCRTPICTTSKNRRLAPPNSTQFIEER